MALLPVHFFAFMVHELQMCLAYPLVIQLRPYTSLSYVIMLLFILYFPLTSVMSCLFFKCFHLYYIAFTFENTFLLF